MNPARKRTDFRHWGGMISDLWRHAGGTFSEYAARKRHSSGTLAARFQQAPSHAGFDAHRFAMG